MAFLDPETVAKIATLPVKARLIVDGALSGMHRARLHGSSVEFAEHKEYSPGDEIRHIDWKAVAKVDRYYVKQFEQESRLTVHLALDASGSMEYAGSGVRKVEYGSLLLAALAYLLIRQRDAVGLTIFGDARKDGYVPPRGRPRHLHDLFSVIDKTTSTPAKGDERPGVAFRRLGELAQRQRCLIVIASDLFDASGETLTALRSLKAQGHDVAVFHVLAPEERSFPFDGMTQFESLEDDRRVLVNPVAVRRDYLRSLDKFLEATHSACTAAGIDYLPVTTNEPLEQGLMNLLHSRAGMSTQGRGWSS